jgi:hypothetical protein
MDANQVVTLKNEANVKAGELQRLLNNAESTSKSIADAEAALVLAVENVNKQIVSDAVEICNNAEKPMLEALKTGFVDKFGVTRKVDKDSKFVSVGTETTSMKVYFPISKITGGVPDFFKKYLPTFSKMVAYAVGRSFRKDIDEKVTSLKSSSKSKPDDVGVKPESLFDIAGIDLDKDILSKNALKKALTPMAVSLLGDDTPEVCSADVRMILSLGTKDSNKNLYRNSKDSTVQKLIQKFLYTRLNGLEYEAEA